MPVSKLKNLALLILLLSNIALLCLLIPRQLAQRQETQQLQDSLVALCEKQDVSLDPDCIPDTIALYPLELANSERAERSALQALVGEDAEYTDSGIEAAALQQTGHWDNGALRLKLQNRKTVSNLRRGAEKTLDLIGFQHDGLHGPERRSAGTYTLSAGQTVLGVPVFSRGLTLTYLNSSLTEISGDFYAGTLTKTADRSCISASDAVVSFLAARLDLGWVGSSITAIEQGYLPSVTAAASIRLTPVWKLTTDTGSFYVNGITSEVIPTENSAM